MSTVFEPITQITNRPLGLRGVNIDTDQILSAQFLSVTSREGLGDAAFYNWRHDARGELIADHILNSTARENHRILVVDRNFGCGSSREHAPWALYDYGVRVILGEQIADIFKSNCLKNGIAAIDVPGSLIESLMTRPDDAVAFDLEAQQLKGPDGFVHVFDIDALSRQCLMSGSDQLGVLLEARENVMRFEQRRTAQIPLIP